MTAVAAERVEADGDREGAKDTEFADRPGRRVLMVSGSRRGGWPSSSELDSSTWRASSCCYRCAAASRSRAAPLHPRLRPDTPSDADRMASRFRARCGCKMYACSTSCLRVRVSTSSSPSEEDECSTEATVARAGAEFLLTDDAELIGCDRLRAALPDTAGWYCRRRRCSVATEHSGR